MIVRKSIEIRIVEKDSKGYHEERIIFMRPEKIEMNPLKGNRRMANQ